MIYSHLIDYYSAGKGYCRGELREQYLREGDKLRAAIALYLADPISLLVAIFFYLKNYRK